MDCDALDNEISIPEYYSGQSILITGGTGLMGKVLVEKILRSCPDIAMIYLLIRHKKGISIQERWERFTQIPLFERLKKEWPNALTEKITTIAGDVAQDGLGLSNEDKLLLEKEVTLIYHVAAQIQFSTSIQDLLEMNVKGTQRVLELARRMSKLKVVVYVSSTFSNSNILSQKTYEEVLPGCQDWRTMLKMIEHYPLQCEYLTEKILCGHVNPYTWSKSLAEQVANDYRCYFPVIIMRPALVISAMDDPIKGWYDTSNAFLATCIAIAYGALRVMPTRPKYTLDFVTVDHAIKAFLIAPWRLHLASKQNAEENKAKMRSTLVYNCAISHTYPITHREMEDGASELIEKYPSENIVWIKTLFYAPNWSMFRFIFIFLQVFPAVIVDAILKLRGKKTMAIYITKKLFNGLRLSYKSVSSKVAFPNKRYEELGIKLKPEDLEAFSFTVKDKSKVQIVIDLGLGYRKYYLKEDMTEEGIERNRVRYNRIKVMHKVLRTVFFFLIGYFLVTAFF